MKTTVGQKNLIGIVTVPPSKYFTELWNRYINSFIARLGYFENSNVSSMTLMYSQRIVFSGNIIVTY